MPLNGPLQMTRAILHVRPLADEELFYRRRATEHELVGAGGLKNPLLHHSQLDFEDLFQVFGTQGAKDHDFVDAVHELGRKLAAGGIYRGAVYLVVEFGVQMGRLLGESHAAVMSELISVAPRFDVMTITHWEKSILRLSPSVNVALSRI